ncbi:MAG: 30S ribosomal protein S10 [Candidatus Micrarchaeota archaeon]
MTKAKITLKSERPADLNTVVSQIKELSAALNMKVVGPVPMPRRRLNISCRRTPCGDGSDTYEHWEKRISKRLIEVDGDEKTIRQLLRIKIPDSVFVKISLVG